MGPTVSMSYAPLNVPDDGSESDVDSIQNSPQLNTESQFAFSPTPNDSSQYEEHSTETPFQAEHDSFNEGVLQHSPYRDERGPTVREPVLPEALTVNGPAQAAEPGYDLSYERAYDPAHVPAHDPAYDPDYTSAYDSGYGSGSGYESSTLKPGYEPAYRSGLSEPASFQPPSLTRSTRKRHLQRNHPLPALTERSPDVSAELEDPSPPVEKNPSPPVAEPLKFARRSQPRPQRASMPPPKDDEDTLPFEATTRIQSDRPQSMVNLPGLSGPVMSSEAFDNYRKSVGSLKMLQKAAKTPRNKDGVDDDENDGDSDDEDEDRSIRSGLLKDDDAVEENAKEQRRKSAVMRQEQDARMSLYRQKMKKIVGHASPGDHRSIVYDDVPADHDDQEIMDDIPLSILQAHGFPRASPRRASPGPETPRLDAPRTQTMSSRSSSPGRPLSMASLRMLTQPARQSITPTGLASPLPSVFGDNKHLTTRGLVGEISREEDIKRRRQTFGYTNVPSSTTHHNPELFEMQTKLDQVINLLSTLSPNGQLSGLAGQQQLGAGQSVQAGSYMGAPSIAAPSLTQASVNSLPSHAYRRAPSIRSGMSQSVRPQSLGASYNLSSGQYPSPMPPLQTPAMGNWMGPPAHTARGGPAPQKGANRPARMRIIQNDPKEDEDDEKEWQEILEKRRALKDEWTKQEVSST